MFFKHFPQVDTILRRKIHFYNLYEAESINEFCDETVYSFILFFF